MTPMYMRRKVSELALVMRLAHNSAKDLQADLAEDGRMRAAGDLEPIVRDIEAAIGKLRTLREGETWRGN